VDVRAGVHMEGFWRCGAGAICPLSSVMAVVNIVPIWKGYSQHLICSCAVVEALDLKEGDEIEISIAGKRDFKVARNRPIERVLEQLRQMKWSFPQIRSRRDQ
jgi:antitoxin component of MazEF toxin-antitoxin module